MENNQESIEQYKKFFKGLGKLLDIIGLLGIAGLIIIFVMIIFGASPYAGKYSEIGYPDVIFGLVISSLIVFFGNKIKTHDFYANWYLTVGFLIVFVMPFLGYVSGLGIILWILFIIQGTRGFLKFGELRKKNLYESVFNKNIPISKTQDHNIEMPKVNNKPTPHRNITKSVISVSNIYIGIFSFAALLAGIGLFYSFALLPFLKNHNLNQCLENSENILTQKKQEIVGHINDLEKERVIAQQEADKKLVEFLQNNPEPKEDAPTGYTGWGRLSAVFSGEHYQWEKNKNNIFAVVRDVDSQKRNIENDFKKVENEKKVEDETCYKKYK